VKPYRGPPATLGSTAAASARIIVWCRDCRHQVEPDAAELAQRYGADTPVSRMAHAARLFALRWAGDRPRVERGAAVWANGSCYLTA
jgi:hypothetical protein